MGILLYLSLLKFFAQSSPAYAWLLLENDYSDNWCILVCCWASCTVCIPLYWSFKLNPRTQRLSDCFQIQFQCLDLLIWRFPSQFVWIFPRYGLFLLQVLTHRLYKGSCSRFQKLFLYHLLGGVINTARQFHKLFANFSALLRRIGVIDG